MLYSASCFRLSSIYHTTCKKEGLWILQVPFDAVIFIASPNFLRAKFATSANYKNGTPSEARRPRLVNNKLIAELIKSDYLGKYTPQLS